MSSVSRSAAHLLAGLVVVLVSLAEPVASHTASATPQADLAQPQVAVAPEPEVTARGAVLWDPLDEIVLYGKEPEVGRPMASTTKIMTSLLALEAGTVDDTVTVSANAADQGEASLFLTPGQALPMRSLVAGLIVRSGNDAATALAEHVAGSEGAFVERMNTRAAELGLTQTRFVNASGLTNDPEHRASPLDLARLAHHAMSFPDFAAYAGAATATVPGLPPMVNRNELLAIYEGATGVKTGYTRFAGLCLVASATRDGRTLYAVVLGSDGDDARSSFRDVAALLDHGFRAFRRAEPISVETDATRYRWSDGDIGLRPADGLGVTVPVEATVTWRARLVPALERPVAAGDEAGTAELLVDGVVRREVPLVAVADAPERAAPAAAADQVGAALQDALRTFARIHAIERAA